MRIYTRLAVAAVIVLAFGGWASASGAGFTRGDAEATFRAAGTGGDAMLAHVGFIPAAPAPQPGLRIRPFQPFNGVHHCSTDWHVIAATIHFAGDSTTVRDDAVQYYTSLVWHLSIDGVPVTTASTAITRDPGAQQLFGFAVGYVQTTGVIVAPGSLALGAHVVHLSIENFNGPGSIEDEGDVAFFLDAARTGACV